MSSRQTKPQPKTKREELNGLLRKYRWDQIALWKDAQSTINKNPAHSSTLRLGVAPPWVPLVLTSTWHSTKDAAHEDVATQAVAYIRDWEERQQ